MIQSILAIVFVCATTCSLSATVESALRDLNGALNSLSGVFEKDTQEKNEKIVQKVFDKLATKSMFTSDMMLHLDKIHSYGIDEEIRQALRLMIHNAEMRKYIKTRLEYLLLKIRKEEVGNVIKERLANYSSSLAANQAFVGMYFLHLLSNEDEAEIAAVMKDIGGEEILSEFSKKNNKTFTEMRQNGRLSPLVMFIQNPALKDNLGILISLFLV